MILKVSNTIKIAILLLFYCYQLSAQSISGVVKNENGGALPFVNIVIKENKYTNKIFTFAKTDNLGKYEIILKHFIIPQNIDSIYVQGTLNGYSSAIELIKLSDSTKSYVVNFVMTKELFNELNEVVIIGKKPKFRVSMDTISFNVSKYSDGTERKIEDIIKKLPGIEVNNNTGEILYKGKSIETLTLDGDDLFGLNYTLGTKNINVDMVEQIDAIDNYSENALLKNIEQGGKVSLNLKLKKNKRNFTGSISTGIGAFDNGATSSDINLNILGTSQKFKSFATLTQNNVGNNHSPFDYYGLSINVEQQKEQNYFAVKVVPETLFMNQLGSSRSNLNNQLFGNYNAIIKINPKLSVKANLYYLKDRITTNQNFENTFNINNDIFVTSDNTFIIKKPQQSRGDLEIKYNTSKSSLVEYNMRVRQENIETPSTIIQNNTDELSSFLKTKDNYFRQDLLYTKKIAHSQALQISLINSFNDVAQVFTLSPSIFNQTGAFDTQKSQLKKTYLESKATYLGSGRKNKYSFTVGGNLTVSPFESHLFNFEDVLSGNNFDYEQVNMFNTGIYNFNYKKWSFSPSYSVRYMHQSLNQVNENTQEKTSHFLFEPAFGINYKLNSSSSLSIDMALNQNSSSEQFLFLNPILINSRTTIENVPNLDLQRTQHYSLRYLNNNLYDQFQLLANVSFRNSNGNFFVNSNINQKTTQIQYFFLPETNKTWDAKFQVSKYIPYIESTFKLSTIYIVSNFRNIVNNSELRQNQSHFLSNTLFWKTAFSLPINFENSFSWEYSNFQSTKQNGFTNNFTQNNSKIIAHLSKKWFCILSTDIYIPNTKKKDERFTFVDIHLKHTPISKSWQASFTLQNLTNEKNFEQIQTSDIGNTIFRSNLITRHFLLNFTYNF